MSAGKVTVIGGGLIGGSLCMALRRKGRWSVACIDLPERLPAIVEAEAAHDVGGPESLPAHVAGSDVVVVATPVKTIPGMLAQVAPHMRQGAVATDVGSVKTWIAEKARPLFPAGVCFVGGHPLAGSEGSGIGAADPLLFKGRLFLLCPYADTPPEALLRLIDFVEDLSAVPMTIEPEEHDRILAAVSHAPQLVAIAVMHAAMMADATHGLLDKVVGPGFLGLTRVAASDASIWRDILAQNRAAALQAVERVKTSLDRLCVLVEQGNLEEIWEPVSRRRRQLGVEQPSRARKLDLRRSIDRHDEQLLKELAGRLRLVGKMAKLKKDREADVVDPDRERRMMRDRREWGRSLDLPPDLVEELFSLILTYSHRRQSAERGE